MDVALHAVHAARHLDVLGAAVSGAHGVDEDQVGPIEPGILVIFQLVRRRRHATVGQQLGTARPHAAHVHPHGRRTRTAIEAEGERTPGGIGDTVQRVGHIEDMGFGFAGGVLERHLGDGRGVVEGLAVNGHGVVRHDRGFVDFSSDRRSGTRNSSAAAAASGRRLRLGWRSCRWRCGRRRRLRLALPALGPSLRW